MIIRNTQEKDVAEASAIYDNARAFMRSYGNTDQWNTNYPNAQDIREDIKNGCSYVCEDENGEIIAVFFFKIGNDKTYDKIYEGNWQSDGEYAVIHRIAVKYQGRGIADAVYTHCFNVNPNLRIDTHRDNTPMQRSLLKNGFKYCGIIYLESTDERLAFQKI